MLEATLEKEIKFLQQECSHPKEQVLEVAYRSSTAADFGPYRVCKLCGWAEEGWAYFKLKTTDYKHDYPRVSQEEMDKYRLGKVHDPHELYHLQYPDRGCDDLCWK